MGIGARRGYLKAIWFRYRQSSRKEKSVILKDIPLVRETMVKAIEQIREIIKPSKGEQLCCYTLDLFRLT